MLHFVTSYMKQNKSRKQTLESTQYGLEISFKFIEDLLIRVLLRGNYVHFGINLLVVVPTTLRSV